MKNQLLVIEEDIGNYEMNEGKEIPKNCSVEMCGYPAKEKDLQNKWWCEEHKERGRWKS